MKLYRLTVKLRSVLITPLAADTLFGHWCWFVRHTRGEAALAELLPAFSTATPPFRISSGFQRDGATGAPMLPMPVWPTAPDTTLRDKKQLKRILRTPRVPFDALVGQPVSFERVAAVVHKTHEPLPDVPAQPIQMSHSHIRVRNTVNRVKGGTCESQGFFEQHLHDARPGALFDIYLDIMPEFVPQIQADMSAMLSQGYGQDASTGAGFFEAPRWEQLTLPQPAAPAWLALSPFVPAPDDPTDISYTLATKYGKLGAAWAFPAFNKNIPWKQPVLMLQPGALALSRAPKGCMITGIHAALPQVVQYALCLALPIALERSSL